ncbi:Glycosyltransferase, catalytic subunit of cellulose synthase and poly-beta-1,6-N-acetylglucosamine synthase [Propionispira arboris]|uniref:Glycosyltransferase, catalytic subunit of cellulose synthase and poly-beta-1,6-N-acetylglucosamine synthase n=1 Tax=Propionispira arboris TaxID=84035 RepID=A0A1H6WDZ6_9FIRM|nr:glycosyltransferase family 2 protein [Propionispira arboris]SEJ12327.1 Glycosyltransferase, catalytic subunit of cellulose synthase and poly-beta-1,6-N-acetylglucosamine synthase [Propionispira arboris]
MNYVFDYIMVPIQIIIFLFTMYYFMIGFCGMWRKKEIKILTPQKTFAVIVAAHNEEQVIGQLIDNLQTLDYPKELYDIYVIADNCEDHTASIAKEYGAIVCERSSEGNRGKGFALEWMFHKLFTLERQYDAVAIFDADNLVHPKFLFEMNNRLCKGDKLVQGYLDAKNPYDTWVSGTFAISFWVIDHIWHLAKTNIGLSSVLGGTGMCITTEVLKKHGWGATCLTEDMEFTMKALAEGIKTTWAHDAIVYDEKPLTFMQSWNQRKRWAQGQFDVAHRFIPKMIKAGIQKRDIRILDGCLHLLQPHFLILSTFFIIISYVQLLFPPFYTNVYNFMPSELMTFIMLGQYILPIIILLKIHVKMKAWFYLLLYPLFIYSWIPIVFIGFFHRNDHEWSHTKHTRALSYDELMGTTKEASLANRETSK